MLMLLYMCRRLLLGSVLTAALLYSYVGLFDHLGTCQAFPQAQLRSIGSRKAGASSFLGEVVRAHVCQLRFVAGVVLLRLRFTMPSLCYSASSLAHPSGHTRVVECILAAIQIS